MVNPTTAMPDAPMSGLANLMAMKGRDNDSMLVHLSPNEVNNLNKLSGNTMTINPDTGLPEGRSRFLEAALPAILSIGTAIATGGASIPVQIGAAGLAGYGGQRLVGKDHDEALTSGLISAATAGLLGGTGSKALEGVVKEGAEEVVTEAGKNVVPTILKDSAQREAARLGQDQAAKMINQKLLEEANKKAVEGSIGEIAGSAFVKPRTLFSTVNEMGISEALKNPATAIPLATQFAGRTGLNALTNQMRDDANRPLGNLNAPVTEAGELFSTPFTQTALGPFTQDQITSNFIGGGTGPYGMNYFNQGYAQAGGPVSKMNQGGLTQFQSIMGNPALQIQNPNPPLSMAVGGLLSIANKQPKKMFMGGSTFDQMLNDPKVLELLQQSQAQAPKQSYDVLASIGANPPQQMNHGGMAGAGMAQDSIMPAIAPLIQVANQEAQQMKTGGMPFEGRVKGQGDGMSDEVPFMIEGEQPALLSVDEYVLPADVVSMIGNGSSDSGSDKIDKGIAKLRQEKYGRSEQPPQTADGLESLMGKENKTPSDKEVQVAGKFEDMIVLQDPPWSVLPSGLNPEEFMYMYTDKTTGEHYFKNINTRKYSVFGSGKL